MADEITRREFLRNSGALIAVGLMAPPWLAQIARADIRKAAAGAKGSDHILVVCQFSGGNDGLNTVIPYAQKQYYAARPTLAIPESKLIAINEEIGLHPSLAGVKSLWDDKQVAIVNGVGYPHPNRSHFRSMEIWQTANPDASEQYGWLGKYLDGEYEAKNPNPVMAVAFGRERFVSLAAKNASVPTFASLADIKAMVGDPDADKALREIQGMDSKDAHTQQVRKATNSALDAMAELSRNLDKYQSTAKYDANPFAEGFKQIAHLIAISPRTRVIYFSAGGFDTHSRQAETQEKLLKYFGDGLNTFMGELQTMNKADKVTVMVFSEFGRRLGENASAGTDHGAAAPMFVVGGSVKGGLYGKYPDLGDLERGDLKYNTDFRTVYQTVLSSWMGAEADSLLGKDFGTLPVFG